MPGTCDQEIASLPLLAGCPGDTEWVMVGGAIGGKGAGGYGRRLLVDVMNCVLNNVKIINVLGTQLDSFNIYSDPTLNGFTLFIFYNQVNRFLRKDAIDPTYPASEWDNHTGGGFQILIPATFTSADIFTVIAKNTLT